MSTVLPSWRDTPTRTAILAFVAAVSDEASRHYLPPIKRVAVFDNDGTLWCEKPMYVQLDFLLRKLAAQAEADPALRTRQPWQAAYTRDFTWLGGAITHHYQGDSRDLQILIEGVLTFSHDQLVEAVEAEAAAFVSQTQHPTLGRPYTACIYQPMLELLRYLEAHAFTCYLVSGGGRDFMRGFAEQLYGIPRERLIGTTVAYSYEEQDGVGMIVQQGELSVIDDGPGKPIQIWSVAGRRPILAAGNSNGDLPMLQFAGTPERLALRLLLLHDDAEREFAYERGAEQALTMAHSQAWTVVSMRQDWERIFPDQP